MNKIACLLLVIAMLFLSGCSLISIEKPRGIVDIKLSSTNGLIDTYTITYTDGSTSTFTITNGADGENGKNGIDGKDGI